MGDRLQTEVIDDLNQISTLFLTAFSTLPCYNAGTSMGDTHAEKEAKGMDYVLTTNALCKSYGSFKALNAVSMHVPKGAIYGFVGKNGAGKTTLIRLICGLQNATSGGYTL